MYQNNYSRFLLGSSALLLHILFLLSCDMGGQGNSQNNNEEQPVFPDGLQIWVDGPSLYERGLLRVIAEDFGDGSMSAKDDEELKTRTKAYFTSKSGSDYPVVWGFDWYAKPLRKGRLVFEVGIPNANYEHSSLITGGYNSTISLRLMIPLADDVSEYSVLDVYTSATNSPAGNPLQNLRIERGDFQTDVEPLLDFANYYRLDTVGGQKRADMLFLPEFFPDTHTFVYPKILPASLRPRLRVYADTTAADQLNYELIARNAFGLPWGDETVQPAGSLEFRLFDTGGTELSSYLLTADQVAFLRDSLLGTTLETSPLASIYHGHQTYQTASETMGGVTYKTATVQRRSGSGNLCRYTIKVAGLSTSEETDDEFIVEVDRCLLAASGHSNSWDTPMDNFFTVMIKGITKNSNALYHMTSAMVKPENQAQAFMVSPTKYTAHLKHSWLVDSPAGYTVLRAWMQIVKPGNLLVLDGDDTDITGAYPDSSYPEPQTLSITLLPSRRTMLESQTRVAPIYLWWPKEEALKIREAFSSAK